MINLLLDIAWWNEDARVIDAIVPILQSMCTIGDVQNLKNQIALLKSS